MEDVGAMEKWIKMTLDPIRADDIETINSHLRFLGDNRALGNSSRRYQLLSYLVQAEIENRGEAINAYCIAVDVLDREHSFDPSIDSIVRVEISRLRSSLESFYYQKGDECKVHINIPKGSKRPIIKILNTSGEQSNSPYSSVSFKMPNIHWRPLVVLTTATIFVSMFLWMKNRPIHHFPDKPSITVFDETSGEYEAKVMESLLPYKNIRKIKSSYWISLQQESPYSIYIENSTNGKINLEVVRNPDNEILSSAQFSIGQGSLPEKIKLDSWVAENFGFYGTIERDYMKGGDYGESYRCKKLTQDFIQTRSTNSYRQARECIDNQLQIGRKHPVLYNSLAILYREEAYINEEGVWCEALSHAIDAANSALRIDPNSAYSNYILMTIFIKKGDVKEAILYGSKALYLTPWDSEIVNAYNFPEEDI